MGILKTLTNAKETINQIDTTEWLIEIDDTLRAKLQKTIFEMYIDVAEVCARHAIPVALIGGSALGAIRHKGFIPWDDDLDLGMTRADYQRFAEVFEQELGDKYILNAPNYRGNAKARFPKVLKKNTVLEGITDARDKNLCRVFLDIFILENVPEGRVHRSLKGTYCNFLEFISGTVFFYENASQQARQMYKKAGKFSYVIRMAIGFLFSWKNSSRWFDLVDRSIQYKKETHLLGIATGRKHYFGEILEKDKLLPYVDATFEGIEVQVFKDQDYYLRNLYGDYMILPPVEKREKHFITRIEL